ncbi:30S ribosomal protein S17 [bacterium BMS3Abin05]|nr:30S ribosomal protein S17 [bacterium BMS3Abin05]GBE28659.1 30S ribosomal protein S17 [bacterium BMS3Bbin03]HDK36243.1 30S ribosomal protein S17 [Bacteroidota bacterium]HDL78529.1 30S ribosomal protein S17 [Bacteroidota bacterium]HDZ12418.1 30S ribosomal protein S17 [Bacteroidota bacterium]
MTENKRGNRRVIIGTVVSDKMDKSRVIKVERSVKHPFYKKYIKRTKKFMVHDENNESHIGDVLKVTEVRPLSRRKRWRLSEIIERAK